METHTFEGSIQRSSEGVRHVDFPLLEPLYHRGDHSRPVLPEIPLQTLSQPLQDVRPRDDDVDIGVSRNPLRDRLDVRAKVRVDERGRGGDERVDGLECLESILPFGRPEQIEEVLRDLGEDVDGGRFVGDDLQRLVVLCQVARTSIAGIQFAILDFSLLLARQARGLAGASRWQRVEGLGEFGDLDGLEVLEERGEGGSEEEVKLLDEKSALRPDDLVRVTEDLGDRVE